MTIFNSRYRLYFLILSLYIVFSSIIRISFMALEYEHINLTIFNTISMLLVGFMYDIASGIYVMIPLVFILIILPNIVYRHKIGILLIYTLVLGIVFALSFGVVAEHIFWEEFGARFNFIAVDYLVYTQEVIGNIRESYPINLILFAIFGFSLVLTILLRKQIRNSIITDKDSLKLRFIRAIFLTIFLPIIIFFTIDSSYSKYENRYEKNISYNGLYQLFSAFIQNRLEYKEFYPNQSDKKILENFRVLKQNNGAIFLNNNIEDITHTFKQSGVKLNKNVVLIVVESLSAGFLKEFKNSENITPNLDSLIDKSLLFTNMFSTGTRTVRGMEAITLSLPPTAGRSIVKRPNNENLFSAGYVFKNRGYKTSFIYGGYGYFDNMNK